MVVSTWCRWHDGFEYGVEAASGGSTNRGSRPLKEGREVAREALLKKKKKKEAAEYQYHVRNSKHQWRQKKHRGEAARCM